MKKIREVYNLLNQGDSQRLVSSKTSLSRVTIKSFIDISLKEQKTFYDLFLLNDDELLSLVTKYKPGSGDAKDKKYHDFSVQLDYISKELLKTGVTLLLLWEEYRKGKTDYYRYTQFCHHYKQYNKRFQATMHFIHKMGEYLQIDYAGDKFTYIDSFSGEVISCEVLVGVLPYSGYTIAYASKSQKQEDFITGICYLLSYIGGVPKNIKMDNLRSGVTKSDRYEPKFTTLMEQLSYHYNFHPEASRVAKPKDKPSVENGVLQVYRSVFAPLRESSFKNLSELNCAITKQCDLYNGKKFQHKTYTRLDLFSEERSVLNALPLLPFSVIKQIKAKVQRNYHIQLGEDKHYYSVPYQFIGSELVIEYSSTTVEIYSSQKRICTHDRIIKPYGYTTIKEHMPPEHQFTMRKIGWDATYFKSKATLIGPYTLAYIERLLNAFAYIEQSYNSCLGLLGLEKKYGVKRLEAACKILANAVVKSYKQVENILKENIDMHINNTDTTIVSKPPEIHENIRGEFSF